MTVSVVRPTPLYVLTVALQIPCCKGCSVVHGEGGFYSHNNVFGSLRHDPVPYDLNRVRALAVPASGQAAS